MGTPRTYLEQLNRSQLARLLLVGLAIGILSAYGAIAVRYWISGTQFLAFGVSTETLGSFAANLAPWQIYAALMGGGLIIGLMLKFLPLNDRPEGVADVIDAANFNNGRMSLKRGLSAALVSATSLGVGASAGREGPVVHLGATLAGALSTRFNLPPQTARILLGCAVAAAVAASFNAPLAGAVFAHEIVLGHLALRSFGPIVIASVAGTVICRTHIGVEPAFLIPDYTITTAFEYPAFALLGLLCGVLAAIFVRTSLRTAQIVDGWRIPLILRPVLGGALVATIAIAFPQVLGVGYEATDMALKEELPLLLLLTLIAAKAIATILTLAFRFGGGVFSPALYIGAMLGGAFGIVAISLGPAIGQTYGLYALAGMGAVASAIMGAPLSTILIVFELTGDYQLTTAVMVAVVMSNITTQGLSVPSYFTNQLEMRGRSLSGGFGRARARLEQIGAIIDPAPITIRDDMAGDDLITALREPAQDPDAHPFVVVDSENQPLGLIVEADIVRALFTPNPAATAMDIMHPIEAVPRGDTVEHVIAVMKTAHLPALPVIDMDGKLVGMVREREALAHYASALEAAESEAAGDKTQAPPKAPLRQPPSRSNPSK